LIWLPLPNSRSRTVLIPLGQSFPSSAPPKGSDNAQIRSCRTRSAPGLLARLIGWNSLFMSDPSDFFS
jgi:hypothetical protein